MGLLKRSTLPNALTVLRVILAPAIFFLVFLSGFGARALAFVLFLVAALSDVWDGHLARKHGWISDFGKLMDPLADKLLLVATLVPLYILSHRLAPVGELPVWGVLPLWVLLVVFGRELLITLLRARAARQGVAVPAGKSGKYKATFQNIFSGSAILWYAFQTAALEQGWDGDLWSGWQIFHGSVVS